MKMMKMEMKSKEEITEVLQKYYKLLMKAERELKNVERAVDLKDTDRDYYLKQYGEEVIEIRAMMNALEWVLNR